MENGEPLDESIPSRTTPDRSAGSEPQIAGYVVHLYENGKLLRTIPRRFSQEMAGRFAEEYSRANLHSKRQAVAGPSDATPQPTLK